MEVGVIKGLVDGGVGKGRNAVGFLQQPGCDFAIALDNSSVDLDIDGRRQTKVQHLSDDVRGQEVKGRAGVFSGQRLSQALNIVRCRVVVFLERDQNIGVARSYESRCAVHEIDVPVSQSNVVEDV